MKNQKGVTLVALVVTIVVLLILAGVSIAMIRGSNGLLTKSTQAVDRTEAGEVKESVELAISTVLTQNLKKQAKGEISVTTPDIAEIVNEIISTNNLTSSDVSGTGNVITYKKGSKEYKATLDSDHLVISTLCLGSSTDNLMDVLK